MKNVMEFLTYNASPALMDIYTSCQSEHGIADDAGHRRARAAVDSRMSPVFVHDPRRGDTLAERFSLEGNPEIGKDWTTTTIEYLDADGKPQLKEIPYTPADFALHEGRFQKHFRTLNGEGEPVPVHQYLDLSAEERHGKTPFVWATDGSRRLVRLAVSPAIIDLTEERRRHWRMLEYLSGLHIDRLEERHRQELDEWQKRYQQSNADREFSIDSIARGMAELAAASSAPLAPGVQSVPLAAVMASRPRHAGVEAKGTGLPLVEITEADMPRCTNCKACYQQVSELFEKVKIMVDGQPKEVSRVIPGVFEKVEITADLIRRASRAASDCDAEIIRFHQPEAAAPAA
jgi:pyruvate-ferredoxin/flavodoxin oxidoreductase